MGLKSLVLSNGSGHMSLTKQKLPGIWKKDNICTDGWTDELRDWQNDRQTWQNCWVIETCMLTDWQTDTLTT